MKPKRIAFIGTGIMGSAMAGRLLGAGHRLTVFNRTAEKARPLVDAGATLAATPAQAAAYAEVVIAIVGDDEASRTVWLGSNGVLAGRPAPGAIAVESSTLSRGWVLDLDRQVREAGLRFIDSPVTGGPDGAREGRLMLLVGAEAADLESARPVMAAYSREVIHFGPVGAGTAYKLVVNLMGAVHAAALAEGLCMAERAGLDLEQVCYALGGGALSSPMVRYLAERMAHPNHDEVYFSTRWRYKDAAYGVRLAQELGQVTPTCEVATAQFRRALEAGLADQNESAIVEMLRAAKS